VTEAGSSKYPTYLGDCDVRSTGILGSLRSPTLADLGAGRGSSQTRSCPPTTSVLAPVRGGAPPLRPLLPTLLPKPWGTSEAGAGAAPGAGFAPGLGLLLKSGLGVCGSGSLGLLGSHGAPPRLDGPPPRGRA